jgi:hypothetical protein
MRKLIVVAVVLVGVGLALFFASRSEGPDVSSASKGEGAAAAKASAPIKRPGTVLQPESPEDLGAKGTADPGSTPTLSQVPSEEDGVLEVEVHAGERPVPGASVRLYWRGPRDPNLNEVAWRLASTGATNEQGRARLASRPGSYLLAVRAQGHAPLWRDVVRPYGEARTLLRLTVEAGQSLTGRTVEQGSKESLPLVELVLTPHGRRMDAWQRPEAPAEERVYASSDARGDFRVENLAPGTYQLEARAPGHARAVLRSVRVPAASPLTVALQAASVIEGFVVDAQGNPAAGAEVQVSGRVPEVTTSGSGGGFSVEVEAGTYTVSARRGGEAGSLDKSLIVSAGKTVRDVRIQLGQGSALEGRVVARSTGAPVAGASVDVSPYGHNGDSGRAVTDGSGNFSVGGLAPGSYDLVVSAPGFSTNTRRALTVSAGERFPIEIQLTGTGAVEGQVRDSAGQPVAGAQVVGGDRWAGSLSSMPAESRTDAEGRYRLEGLSVGSQSITARREGATLGASQRVSIKEGVTAQADFTLEETGTVEGVIRAASGSLPAEQLLVLAFPQHRGRGPSFSFTDFRPIEADPGGSFRLVLPPGTYEMRAVSSERRAPGSRESKTVEVEAGKTVRAELTLAEERGTDGLQGVVLEPDGSPSAGAFVSISSEGSRRSRWMSPADEQGRFSIAMSSEGNTNQGRLNLTASNGGRLGEVQGVRPGERNVVVKLRPAASARGRVVRASGGAPVQGFTLTVLSQDRGSFMMGDRTWEFPGDRFELRDVLAAPVKLRVRTTDGAGGEALVTPMSGSVTEVEISVKSMAGVRGRVVDATTKAPLSEVLVFIEGERPGDPDNATTGDGRFSLEGVAPGERTLVLMGSGMAQRMERRSVTLVEGQVLEMGDVELSPPRVTPGTIGAVVNPEGAQLSISHVTPEGPAARAGLQAGDVLLKVDGTAVTTSMEAFRLLRGTPGSQVVLTVRRAGSERSISVTRAP